MILYLKITEAGMRTFALVTILTCLWLFKPGLAQAEMNLFVVEKPIESYQEGDLDELFKSAMRDLLIRAVGANALLQTAAADTYLSRARQWVKHYQFVNREVDGVVIGRKLVVEFERERLLNAFQRDQIHIWPVSERPKTLLVGQWEQRGLAVNLSDESLHYRVDLDYRDHAALLGLPISLWPDDRFYQDVNIVAIMQQSVLPPEWLTLWRERGQDYVMLFKADVIGTVTRFEWAVFSLSTGKRVRHADESGEVFLQLLTASLESLLSTYSREYRESAGSLGLLQIDIHGLQTYDDFVKLEQALLRQRPRVQDVKLIKVEPHKVRFELVYQGYYADVVKHLSGLSNLQNMNETVVGMHLRADFKP